MHSVLGAVIDYFNIQPEYFCSGDWADSMAFPIVHVSHWGSTSADWVDIALAPTTPHHEDNSPNYYTSDGDLRVVFCC